MIIKYASNTNIYIYLVYVCVYVCVLQGIIRVLFDLKKVCANVKCARSTDDIRK